MSTIMEVEKLALNLPVKERATLAANLLDSPPGILSEEDEGVAEALRRDAEANVNPLSPNWTRKLRAGATDASGISSPD